MKMTIAKMIGKNAVPFEVEGKNLFELIMASKKLSFRDVHKCGLCESDLLYLNAYITTEGNYEYTKIVCAGCRASITFGQTKKDKDVFFLRKNDEGGLDWQAYVEQEKK